MKDNKENGDLFLFFSSLLLLLDDESTKEIRAALPGGRGARSGRGRDDSPDGFKQEGRAPQIRPRTRHIGQSRGLLFSLSLSLCLGPRTLIRCALPAQFARQAKVKLRLQSLEEDNWGATLKSLEDETDLDFGGLF